MESLNISGENLISSDYLTENLRGLTPGAWLGFDRDAARNDPAYGFYHFEDFRTNAVNETDDWTPTQATAGTKALGNGPEGFGRLLTIDCNSATTGQGYQLQNIAIPITPAAGMTIHFEVMGRLHDIATMAEFAAGLCSLSTAIITSGTSVVVNHLLFQSLGTAGIYLSAMDAATTDVSGALVHTPLDADVVTDGSEWFKLAFRWEYQKEFRVFVQGQQVTCDTAITSEPAALVYPSFVCQTHGTTDPILRLAHFAVGYRYK